MVGQLQPVLHPDQITPAPEPILRMPLSIVEILPDSRSILPIYITQQEQQENANMLVMPVLFGQEAHAVVLHHGHLTRVRFAPVNPLTKRVIAEQPELQ